MRVCVSVSLPQRYVDDRGQLVQERKKHEFRGTKLYASAFAHNMRDLGRRDDLWSFFYSLLVLIKGRCLPWHELVSISFFPLRGI